MVTSPSLWLEIGMVLALGVLLTLPGLAWMMWSRLGRGWPWLSRLTLIVAVSAVFYPLLLTLTPFVTWGRLSLGGLLLLLVVITWWGWRVDRDAAVRPLPQPSALREAHFGIDGLDGAACLVLLLTLVTRLWMAHQQPFPAWTDSLHHTLLTALTATQGHLPTTLEPYFPISLDMYHVGLYALAAPVIWLTGAPAHSALLWTAQVLNGLCGIGVYLVLERYVGRVAALVGLACAGLYAMYPAFYVNWGRYTQLSAQVVLPVAWIMTVSAVATWSEPRSEDAQVGSFSWSQSGLGGQRIWLLVIAAALSAGVFLFHYRVAAFYLLWLGIGLLMVFVRQPSWARTGHRLVAVALIGVLALVLLSPVVGQAVNAYVVERAGVTAATAPDPVKSATVRANYFYFPLEALFTLGLQGPLFAAVAVAGLVALIRRNWLSIGVLIWMLLLYGLGYTYLLGIAMLNITNLGGTLILFYIPGAIVLGAGVEELVRWLPSRRQLLGGRVAAAVALIIALYCVPIRLNAVEPYRYFVTPEDARALLWMRENTPPDALVAVNTFIWLPDAPHGTDAGYWVPYLARRQMTTGVMLLNLAEPEYREQIVALSQAVVAAAADPDAVAYLADLGVDYIYDGAWGNFSGPAFQAEQLAELPGVEVVYQDGPVAILQLTPTRESEAPASNQP